MSAQRRGTAGVIGALALFAVSGSVAQTSNSTADQPIIKIEDGQLSGITLDSGVRAYLGIPYAAPPVQDLRWREPQRVHAWKGVYHADRYGPECIQVLRRHDLNHYFGEEATSEDCLYLNIWEGSEAHTGGKSPVVVYIYGGGFTIGSSGMALYGGENIAKKGVIFVSFNYRLGALGFMAHPDLSAESSHHVSGDYGFLDQIAALHWISANISQFGGDPQDVTIVGQSAGAMSVSALEASPLAKGLFHRGFAMSLSMFDRRFQFPSLSEAEKAGLEVQKALGAESIAEMRALPADKILALQKDCQLGCAGAIAVGPSIDGYFLPDTVPHVFASGKQNDVPTVSGFTRDESSNELRAVNSLEDYIAVARRLYGGRAEQFLELYPARDVDEAKAMGNVAARESQAEAGSHNWAISESKNGRSPFYMYMFSRVHPFSEKIKLFDNPAIGAYHTSDVPYWFETLDALNRFRMTREWTTFDRELAEKMSDCLVAFAKTGSPETPRTPWPVWRTDRELYVDFGDNTSVQSENTARLDFQAQSDVAPPTPRPSRD
jgi:para-nitrobenzyl esterase